MLIKPFPLPHFDERPRDSRIDTLIIHSMQSPLQGRELDPQACFETLDQARVSAHYVIDCGGAHYRLVEESKRAWHAGVSKLPFADDQRESVNDFSIGIELLGISGAPFSPEQYRSLSELTADILSRHPLAYILGHEHIAPGRKMDPGRNFDWNKYRDATLALCGSQALAKIKFGAS